MKVTNKKFIYLIRILIIYFQLIQHIIYFYVVFRI